MKLILEMIIQLKVQKNLLPHSNFKIKRLQYNNIIVVKKKT